MVYDLFGDIPVTHRECYLWVKAVAPRYLTPKRAYDNYVRSYDVVGKIKAAKLRGTYYLTIEARDIPWHDRLAINRII